MAGDHPDVPFVQAKKFGVGRPDGPPLWIVWHTMEEEELPDTAERVARYFATLSDGRTVSSHYCVDADSIIQCVRLRDVAYTVGNRPGNYRGINVELAGRAAQTAAQWADTYSQAMLRRACTIVARDMRRYAIPNRWCTVENLRALRPGHTTHNDLRLAFGGTTHTDPGAGFPRQQVLALVAGGEDDDMFSDEDRHALLVLKAQLGSLLAGHDTWTSPGGERYANLAARQLAEVPALRAEVAAARSEEVARDAALAALIEHLGTLAGYPLSDAQLQGLHETLQDATAVVGERVLAELRRQEAEREAGLAAQLAAQTEPATGPAQG